MMKETRITTSDLVSLAIPEGVFTQESKDKVKDAVKEYTENGCEAYRFHLGDDDISFLVKPLKRFKMCFKVDDKRYVHNTTYENYQKIKDLLNTNGDVEIRINGRIRNFRKYHYSHMEESPDKKVNIELEISEKEKERREHSRKKFYSLVEQKMQVDISNNPPIK